MNGRYTILVLAAALFFVATIPASQSLAHKIGIFAMYDGEVISGEVYLSGGGRPSGCTVRVEDGSPEAMEVKTDENGEFRFKPRTTNDHLLTVDTGDGHRTEFKLSGTELGGAVIASDDVVEVDSDDTPEISAEPSSDLDRETVAPIVRQIAELRRELDEQNRQVRLRDIIGSIGYIFGLAGILMMIKARSHSVPPKN